MRRKLSAYQIWGAPILIGMLSLLGLVSALVSDSFGDWLAWFTLAIPVWIIAASWQQRIKKP